jgi:pyridoxine kinase
MRILAISSQVVYGPVGNTAAVPALQARGHEVLAIPTITLSNHPGHGKPAGFRTAPEELEGMLEKLEGLGALSSCGAVLTGYFASPEQVKTTAKVLVRMKSANPGLFILVDPVMGDEGGLYVPEAVADALRQRLLPLASCITPNRFELEWLAGMPVTNSETAIAAARMLGIGEVLATSIPQSGQLATLLVMAATHHESLTPKLAQVPHGTGDFLSGLYLASRVITEPQTAFVTAMKTLARAIAMSARTSVLNVAGALHPLEERSETKDKPS